MVAVRNEADENIFSNLCSLAIESWHIGGKVQGLLFPDAHALIADLAMPSAPGKTHPQRVILAEMENRPLSQQMLKAIHKLLMQGVGEGANHREAIGMSRIGSTEGCTIEEASFVPIGSEHLQQGMDDWERYGRSFLGVSWVYGTLFWYTRSVNVYP